MHFRPLPSFLPLPSSLPPSLPSSLPPRPSLPPSLPSPPLPSLPPALPLSLCNYVSTHYSSNQEVLIQPALSLLNSHGAHFDVTQVLELLPHDWPLLTVKSFLVRGVRGTMDAHRTSKIEYNLAKGENLQVIFSGGWG